MRRLWLLLAIAAGLLITFPVALDSCSIGPPLPIFETVKRPADVTGEFVRGRLGVVRPSWDPNYLIGAFRILSGRPLTQVEIEALYPTTPDRDERYRLARTVKRDQAQSWEWRRQELSNDPAKHVAVLPYKRVETEGSISSFLNCNADAFETAALTLRALQAEWGLHDPKVMAWVFAQDQVFANCSSMTPTIPEPAGPSMNTLLAAHRRYQIAAAQFYAGQFQKAADGFLAIAKETDSPWRSIAPYLAARALMRAGQFTEDRAAETAAKRILEVSLQDQAFEQWHEDSEDLLGRLLLRIAPIERLAELGSALERPAAENLAPERIGQMAIDFVFALRRRPVTEADQMRKDSASELAAWLNTISAPSPIRGTAASERWRKTANPAWLIASLMTAPDSAVDELLSAAAKVSLDSPAFDSVAYYAAIREERRGRLNEARKWADRALAKRSMVRSGRNMLLALRTRLARDWDEFLLYGLRRPETLIADFDGNEDPNERAPLPDGSVYAFDSDVTRVLNSEIPLHLWIDATRNPILPAYLQLRIAESGWFRAVMLGRFDDAKRLLRRIVELDPGAAQGANQFLSSEDPEQLRHAALFLYLRSPGLSPTLQEAQTENEKLGRPHASRRCPFAPPIEKTFPAFLNISDRKAAQEEIRQLNAVPPWLATVTLRETIDWAHRQPSDSRIPEALSRAIRMSFYGCKDDQTGKYSEQAFQLLHSRYQSTTWAAETKYWYR